MEKLPHALAPLSLLVMIFKLLGLQVITCGAVDAGSLATRLVDINSASLRQTLEYFYQTTHFYMTTLEYNLTYFDIFMVRTNFIISRNQICGNCSSASETEGNGAVLQLLQLFQGTDAIIFAGQG
ncbi:Ionotropic receptor 211, partial [Hyalella azteca]